MSSALSGGRRYGAGDSSGEIPEGHPVRFREISRDLLGRTLVQAVVFYGDRDFAALQLVWPDRDGNFSSEEGAPAWLGERQALVA